MDGLLPEKESNSQPLGGDTKQGIVIDSKESVILKEEGNSLPLGGDTKQGIVIDNIPKEEGNSLPLGGDTKQGILIDSKDYVMPKEECKAAMYGDFFYLESKTPKMYLKTEQDFLDCKGDEKILHENFITKSDLVTAKDDAGAACCVTSATPSGKNLDSMSCNKQDGSVIKEKVVPADVNQEIIPSPSLESVISPVEKTMVGDQPCVPEIAKNKTKKRRYKKRKLPPPFIGPQRPIQFEDLEDIMNGVYDLDFDTPDTDEESLVFSSSNESCDSSDPEGWLVESGDEAGAVVGGWKVSNNVSKRVEVFKTALDNTKAAKDQLVKTINFIGTEANVAALDATVREMVNTAEPQLQAGLDALAALANAPIAALSLLKHTHLLETAALLCQYSPPNPFDIGPRGSADPALEEAMRISFEAGHILGRMMSLLKLSAESDSWPAVVEMTKNFAEQTKDMTTDQIYLLTEYPEGGNVIEYTLPKMYPMMSIDDRMDVDEFADDESDAEQVLDVNGKNAIESTLPKMYPMMSIDDRMDVDEFADDESDAEQVPVLKEIERNKQTGWKSKRCMTAIEKDKSHRKSKNMKENLKKSNLIRQKSLRSRTTRSSGLRDPSYEPPMSDAQLLQSSDSDDY